MDFYMINNRRFSNGEFSNDLAKDVSFHRCPRDNNPRVAANWERIDAARFVRELIECGNTFPVLPDYQHEQQKHLSLFVHGYNNSWEDSVSRYVRIEDALYRNGEGLGALVLLSWPSNGSTAAYLADRSDAEDSAPGLAALLVRLHDHLIGKQREAAKTGDVQDFCRAKISIIAHSMGNYVVQKALATASKRLNNPQLVTLINQLVMVAADVDNDLFQKSKPDTDDGSLMANLCYRVAALYSGLDSVLGASAGLKHFGTRRLGRSGLANRHDVHDNVFDLDVSEQIRNTDNKHSGVFDSPSALAILRQILIGVDRAHLQLG